VGARSPAQVDGWIGAARLTLTAADLDEIALAIEKIGVGAGPTRPPVIRDTRSRADAGEAAEARERICFSNCAAARCSLHAVRYVLQSSGRHKVTSSQTQLTVR